MYQDVLEQTIKIALNMDLVLLPLEIELEYACVMKAGKEMAVLFQSVCRIAMEEENVIQA